MLRVLEEKQYYRVGATKKLPADIRVTASNNKDLKREVLAGNFREDLFYRLNVASLNVPSLRERKKDIIFAILMRSSKRTL
nr:hypothetical protein [Desulfobacterales bacterium]